ncbi:MAG: AbrB/MazE/SpoVT family DNA-binding domain-containing protein [Candidatus Eremiobacteraeota bacterium]|nr:AbrB/MazE/SpoVT family DNA-binding domain-containing protein [Candidatus Eremiobacteraeota bacterium]
MAIATLTSKGQMTLPKAIQDGLGLKPSNAIEVSIEGQRAILIPKNLRLDDIASILPSRERTVSIDEMNEAIHEASTESAP